MKFKLANLKKIKMVIEAMDQLIDDVTFTVTKTGFKANALEKSGSSFISIDWAKADFLVFEAEEKEEFSFKIKDIKTAIRRTKGDEEVEIEIGDFLILKTKDKNAITTHTIPLLSEELFNTQKSYPGLEFNIKVDLSSDRFKEIIESLEDYSMSFEIFLEADKLIIGTYEAGKKIKHEIKEGPNLVISSESREKETTRSAFSTDIIKRFLSPSKYTERTTIQWSKDYPIIVNYSIPNLTVTFLSAPRIESE